MPNELTIPKDLCSNSLSIWHNAAHAKGNAKTKVDNLICASQRPSALKIIPIFAWLTYSTETGGLRAYQLSQLAARSFSYPTQIGPSGMSSRISESLWNPPGTPEHIWEATPNLSAGEETWRAAAEILVV